MKNRQKTKPPAVPVVQPVSTVSLEDRAHELYMEHQKQAWADCQSGSDEFDKSILTYSTAGLGVSLVFLKDLVPLQQVVGVLLLYASWVLFGIAILVTVFSFQLSVLSQEKHLEHLREYYLEREAESLNAPNRAATWVGRLKWVSGLCFVLAMVGTIAFSIWNLEEAKHMSDNHRKVPVNLQEGRKLPGMTPLDLGKGRQPGAITPLPAAPQAPVPPPPQTPATK